MNTTKVAVVGISLFMAVGAAFLFSSMLGSEVRTDELGEPFVEKEVVVTELKVLVASRDIGPGDKLSAENLKWQTWSPANVVADFITDQAVPNAIAEYTGGLVRSALFEGEPIDSSKVASLRASRGFMSVLLNPGKRAYSINMSPVSGAGGFILPGDYVDILLTYSSRDSGSGESVARTKVLLQNIRIMAIDQSTAGLQGSIIGRTATVEVSRSEARVLASGAVEGSISLALRSLSDASDETISPVSSVAVIRAGRKSIVSTQ